MPLPGARLLRSAHTNEGEVPEWGRRPDPGRGGEGWGVLEFPRLPSIPWASFFLALGQKGLVQCSGSIPSLGPSEAQSCCLRPRPRTPHELGIAQLAFQALQLTGPVHHLRTFPGPESRFPEAVGSSQHCAGPGLESGQVGRMRTWVY